MRLLLDTHLLHWMLYEPHFFPDKAKKLLDRADLELFFSAASIWETAIKHAIPKYLHSIPRPEDFRAQLEALGATELPVTSRHAEYVSNLPTIHGDPFDRMLIAQAVTEGLTLLTSDSMVARYPGPIMLV